jgi:HPt (histidine-containing phosphotransfer) domain-containing protein
MTEQHDRFLQIGVNLPELLSRVENDYNLLGELIGIFKEEFPRLLQLLRESITREDMKNVEVSSHALKGMLSALSVTRAAAIASRLEQMGRDGKTEGLTDVLILIEREVANSMPELDTYIAEMKR